MLMMCSVVLIMFVVPRSTVCRSQLSKARRKHNNTNCWRTACCKCGLFLCLATAGLLLLYCALYVCLFCVLQKTHVQISANFLYMLSVTMAQSSDGSAYVMYFWFGGWCHAFIHWRQWAQIREFVGWQHGGQSLPSATAFVLLVELSVITAAGFIRIDVWSQEYLRVLCQNMLLIITSQIYCNAILIIILQ